MWWWLERGSRSMGDRRVGVWAWSLHALCCFSPHTRTLTRRHCLSRPRCINGYKWTARKTWPKWWRYKPFDGLAFHPGGEISSFMLQKPARGKGRVRLSHVARSMRWIEKYVQDWTFLRNLRKLWKFVIIVISVKFAFLVEPLSSQATRLKERGIIMLYLPTEICWRAQQELRQDFTKITRICEKSQVSVRFVIKWMLAKKEKEHHPFTVGFR